LLLLLHGEVHHPPSGHSSLVTVVPGHTHHGTGTLSEGRQPNNFILLLHLLLLYMLLLYMLLLLHLLLLYMLLLLRYMLMLLYILLLLLHMLLLLHLLLLLLLLWFDAGYINILWFLVCCIQGLQLLLLLFHHIDGLSIHWMSGLHKHSTLLYLSCWCFAG
jgi:hypothetical protein